MTTSYSGVTFYTVSGVLLLILVVLSALVSGSEVGLFSLSPIELADCKNSDNKKEKLVFKLLQRPQLLLASILIFNNLINISIVTISTFVTWAILGTKEMSFFVFFIQTFLITAILLIFGELLPKVYANQKNLSFAKLTVPMISFAVRFFKPFSFLLMSMGNFIERRIEKKGYNVSSDQLKGALEVTSDTSDKEKEILKGIINLHSIQVKQIMVSRLDVMAFDIDMNFDELTQEIKTNNHSRIPIYKETIDHISGFLYIKDLLPFLDEGTDFKWQRLIRESYFVPQNKKIDKLLKDFQEKHIHIAIVVDEYGGTAGLVTLEDILEEIVGEINDEQDETYERLHLKIDDKNYFFESKILLQDFSKVMGLDSNFFDEVKGDSESLGGLILELFTRLPSTGESIQFKNYLFTVASVGKRKIKVVKVTIFALENTDEE